MLFLEEDAPLLKKWIVRRLENTSDADADVLADYVLALLRHDGDEHTVRQLCEAEIPDFLKEDSSIFVADVFDAIHYKSYMPGYTAPPRRSSMPFVPPTGPSAPSYGNLGMSPPIGAPMGPQNGSRKRSYNERGDGDLQNQGFQGGDFNGRSYKQPRRGGAGAGRGNFDGFNPNGGRGGGFGGRPAPMNLQNMAQYPAGSGAPLASLDPSMAMTGLPSPPTGLPVFDPNNPLSALLAMQALGLPMPTLPGFPQPGSPVGAGFPAPKRPRCIDYDQKGFCAKGNTCQFEHGEHSIWVPPAKRQDEYDPTNSSLMGGPRGGFNQFRGGDRGRVRGGLGIARAGGQFSGPLRRGGRSEFSSDRPNYDRSNTSIVVENIPEENFTEDAVRTFFAQFGKVLEVDMRPYKRLAIIKYEDYDMAKAAHSSPKVVFDNRFVKVYWFANQESLPQPPASEVNASAKNGSKTTTPVPARSTSEPQIDIKEFAKRQEEAQKLHEQKAKKAAEMEIAKKELEKRQIILLERQAEAKRQLMAKLAAKKGARNSATPPIIKTEDSSPDPQSESKSNPQTEALKAQLAALEAEAHSLGIDPSQADEPPWAGRGRGRGRGIYRGRGAFAPRGFRGGYRGRGGPPFAAGGRSFNLDNRTRKVGLTGVDFSDPEKDESLRQYLLGIGEFTEIEVMPNLTAITFKDRFTAEKFIHSTTNGEIPSVGKVDMAWIQTPLPPVSLPAKTAAAAQNGASEDTHMEEGDAMVATSSPAQAGGDHESQENLDYDVADDNDWGPE